jgi:hypothetical protein
VNDEIRLSVAGHFLRDVLGDRAAVAQRATAHDRAVPLPIVSVIREHMLEAIATGHADQDGHH